ncbi:unnamed protein product, partial [Ascophyllum nodosum]
EGDVIDVCGVSPREIDTESVPMETVRQHKEGIIVGVRRVPREGVAMLLWTPLKGGKRAGREW